MTSGRNVPSARFRVRQHLPLLAELGVTVREKRAWLDRNARPPGWPASVPQRYAGPLWPLLAAAKLAGQVPGLLASWRHQVTWLQKEMLPGLPSLEALLHRPLVFDVDDATWLIPPFGEAAVRHAARRARTVLAGNAFLAERLAPDCADVRIVPTAIDSARFSPAPEAVGDRPFTLGWTGTAGNLASLRAITPPLGRFLRRHRRARLLIVADRAPSWPDGEIPEQQVAFQPWSEDREVAAVRQMDVGLMPLPDTVWARGKCSFKMLQYLACGVPALVSPVGMNGEIVALGKGVLGARSEREWEEALEDLHADPHAAQRLGLAGRELIEERFSHRIVGRRLAEIFLEIAG